MAEVLAVAASGAGLASLAIQIAAGARHLRQRYEHNAKLQQDVEFLTQDLDLISKQLDNLEAATNDILEQEVGPILLGKCRHRSTSVIERVERLLATIPEKPSKRHLLQDIARAKQRRAELEDIKSLVADLKQDIILLKVIEQNGHMQKLLRKDTQVNDTGMTRTALSSAGALKDLELRSSPALSRHRVVSCAILSCHCSCHKTHLTGGRFWRLKYSPLAEAVKQCDVSTCTARRYRVELRVSLSRLGVPLSVALGVNLTTEPGKFWLQPALLVERVVKYTAPGFVTLWKLSNGVLSWEDAESTFRDLYQSDPTFPNQVDPEGRGYLEKAVAWGAGGLDGMPIETLSRLLEFFVKELRAHKGLDSSALMYNCAALNEDNCHLPVITTLVALGCDYSTTISPNFESWPKPSIHDIEISAWGTCIIIDDPFYVEFLDVILKVNPVFGGSTPLHDAVMHASDSDFELLVQKSRSSENQVNFLGQTPVHFAVLYPARLTMLLDAGHDASVGDKNGITPLMYASAMNLPEAVSILIDRDADLLVRDTLENYDFVQYGIIRCNWSLIWQAIDLIERKDSTLLLQLLPSLFTTMGADGYLGYDSNDLGNRRETFWMKVLSKLPTANVCFYDGATLMHFIDHPSLAKVLVGSGFNKFNQKNHLGEHCLFPITQFLDASLVQLFVAKGCDVNIKNKKGQTVLHQLVDHLSYPSAHQTKKLLDTLDVLLDSGAIAIAGDHCSCPCSPAGCIPGSDIRLEVEMFCNMTVNNAFWVFEWCLMLEERGRLAEARDFALSILRRTYFEEAGLRHTCCQGEKPESVDDDEDEFWDISHKVRLDELDDKMRDWERREYEEIRLGLRTHLYQRQLAKEAEVEATKEEKRLWKLDRDRRGSSDDAPPHPKRSEIDYEADRMYSSLDMALLYGFGSDSFDWFDPTEDHETRSGFDEFVSELRCARGEKFSSRLAMVTELSDIFGYPLSNDGQED